MQETIDYIMNALEAYCITDKSYEDVVAEFRASDALSPYLQGADSDEAVAQRVSDGLPDYIEAQGVPLFVIIS